MTRAQEIESRVRRVVRELAGSLPEDDVDSILGLLEAGEWGIALENLCTQLDEYHVAVPLPLLDEIAQLGDKMGLDPGCWGALEPMEL